MNAESRGGAGWDEVRQDHDRGRGEEAPRRRGPVVQMGLAQAMVGVGQAIPALGSRSRTSLPALGGGCGGGSVAVQAAVLARRRLRASRRRQEAGRVALHGHKEGQARWAGGRRGPRAAAWVPR